MSRFGLIGRKGALVRRTACHMLLLALVTAAPRPSPASEVIDDTFVGHRHIVSELIALPPDQIVGVGDYVDDDGVSRGFVRFLRITGAAAVPTVLDDAPFDAGDLRGALFDGESLWLGLRTFAQPRSIVLRGSGSGASWSFSPNDEPPENVGLYALARGPQGIFAVGGESAGSESRFLIRRSSSGRAWATVDDELGGRLGFAADVATTSAAVLAAGFVEDPGRLLHWIVRRSADGKSWKTVDDVEGQAQRVAADPRDPRTFYVAGTRRTSEAPTLYAAFLRVTRDAGDTWETIDSVDDTQYQVALHVTDSGRVFWAAYTGDRFGTEKGILRTTSTDGTFVDFDRPPKGYFWALTSLTKDGGETLYAAWLYGIDDMQPDFRWATTAYVLEPPHTGGAGGDGGGGAGMGGDGGTGSGGSGGSDSRRPNTSSAHGCDCATGGSSAQLAAVAAWLALVSASMRGRRRR